MSYEGLLQRWRIYDDINYKLSILRYYSGNTKFPVVRFPSRIIATKCPCWLYILMCINIGVGCCLLFGWRGKGNTCVSSNSGSHTLFLCPKLPSFNLIILHKRSLFLTLSNSLYLKEGYKFQVIA